MGPPFSHTSITSCLLIPNTQYYDFLNSPNNWFSENLGIAAGVSVVVVVVGNPENVLLVEVVKEVALLKPVCRKCRFPENPDDGDSSRLDPPEKVASMKGRNISGQSNPSSKLGASNDFYSGISVYTYRSSCDIVCTNCTITMNV